MNTDFLDLLTALSAAEARFLVVGGYAVGVLGRPRATKDLDVWIEASADNAKKAMQALRDFGAPLGDLTERDLEAPGTGFKMGEPPSRIDILTQIEGVRRSRPRASTHGHVRQASRDGTLTRASESASAHHSSRYAQPTAHCTPNRSVKFP